MGQGQENTASQSGKPDARPPGGTEPDQIERILRWIGWAMVAGLVILAVNAATLEGSFDGWRFFSVGAMAALVSVAAGGALGLLFGLPISRARAARDYAGGDGAAGDSRADWFSDNASMEEIADWLTKIIVGLTLTQWASIQDQFNRLAAAVSAAMLGAVAGEPADLRAIGGDAGMVPGGIIIGAYAVIGFVAVYLWARRYLADALARGRAETRKRQHESDKQFFEKVQHHGAVQQGVKSDQAQADAERAVEAEQAKVEEQKTQPAVEAQPAEGELEGAEEQKVGDGAETYEPGGEPVPQVPKVPIVPIVPIVPFETIVGPGQQSNDPWRGQFGGKSTDGTVLVSAEVRPLESSPGLFAVEIKIGTTFVGSLLSAIRRVKKARIYLHPTFPEPIRVMEFSKSGEIELPLVAFGAFTLGVQLQDGRLLELNLAELPSAPPQFRMR